MGGRAAQEAAPEAEQALSALLSAKLPGIRALLRSSGSQTVVLNGHAYYINKGAGRTAVTIKTRVDATRMLKHLLCCNSNLAIQEAVLVKCIREIHGWMAARGPRGVGLTQAEGDEVYEICQRVKRLEGYDETGSEEEEEEEGDGAAGGGADDDDDDDDDDEDDGDDDYRPSSPREPARDEPVALRPRHAGDASPDVNAAGRAAAAAGIAAAAAAGAAQVARTEAMPPGHEASERGTMASPPPPPPAMTERERKRKAWDERAAQLSRDYDAALAAQEAADAAARAASARKRQADDHARRASEQARRAGQEERVAQAAAAAAAQAVADLEQRPLLPRADLERPLLPRARVEPPMQP